MRLIILFILLSLGADAQIIRANAFYRPTAAAGFLLDAYPNAAAAYSLRKLKSSYSGSAIRIRRDSTGNAETDIGFTANGDLDTTAIKNHCRNNSCMVTTWYNQGDSTAVNFTQTTAAAQPRIMTSGVIERRAGEPTVFFDTTGTDDFMSVASSTAKFNYLHQAGQAAVFLTWQIGITSSNINNILYVLDNTNGATGNRGYILTYDDRASQSRNDAIVSGIYRGAAGTSVSLNAPNNYFTTDTLRLLSNLLDNSTATAADRNSLYRNGSNEQKLNISTQSASTLNASFNLRIGAPASAGGNTLIGYVSELVLYPTNQSSTRTGIETNINNYYGLW